MGGKGANQAVVAARLGAQVTFVASVGNDGFGSEAISAYQSEGIDTQFIRRATGQPTGTAAIMVDNQAENCIIVVAGANSALAAADVQSASEVIRRSQVVLCQLETPAAAAVEAFRIARGSDTITVLTPAPAAEVTSELLSLCDICVPNATEISAMTGQDVDNETDAVRAANLLRDRGVDRVALTLGGRGVLLVDNSGATHIPATPVSATDTTGAGDAFTGALGVGLAEGHSLEEAATRAATVAAISVTRLGTQTSFPTLEA
jgi:ribokinase